MTGYESKRAAAQDKLKQWDTPSEAFNEWWNGEYDDSTNPFTKHSLAYWAFAGWQAALAQPEQEPVGFVDSKLNPLQRPWVEPTGNEWFEWWRVSQVANETEAEIDFADFLIIAQAVMAKLKEKNNG